MQLDGEKKNKLSGGRIIVTAMIFCQKHTGPAVVPEEKV
jgi:hypothetical protein